MLSNDEVRDAIALNHEVRFVEFKGHGLPADKHFMSRVARAALAMANQRGGGYVFIGVDDTDPGGPTSGLSDEEVHAWLDFDDLSAKVNVYADPPLAVEVAARKHPNGNTIVLIEIGEFNGVPVLCRKAFDGVLEVGHLYTRSLAKPESSRYHTHAELREVIELAVEKGLQSFLVTARHAGMGLGATDRQRFDDQLSSFFDDDGVITLRSDSYVQVTFFPRRTSPADSAAATLRSKSHDFRFKQARAFR